MRLVALPLAVLLLATAPGVYAQTAEEVWLASPKAAEFRARVVQLALIYGESSGIDAHDLKLQAHAVGDPAAGCADVEVVTSKDGSTVRRELVHACRSH